jgi:tetratricopeptide (TPR) repeat protein/tRNA A-37 threonylcarbamoyl transferase component Bud32
MTDGGGTSRMRPVAIGPLVPGESFGTRYHVIRALGAGGMGAVYQAWDEELGVAVAIKVIRPEVLADPDASEEIERRFKRELLLARQVTHRNVVRIHDLGEIDGIKYITMPYIQGSDLATVLKRQGKLSVSRAIAIARQVAAGLSAAHEAGVVHRDLKPENIMIDGDFALIMDFGIARGLSAVDGTMVGVVRGTIGYMAPEQARGENVDQRADVYSFGLILYDMLLGRVRHTKSGQTAVAELMERMQRAPQSAREVDPEIPAEVDEILNRCVEPDPANRYQTSAELVQALEQLDPEGHLLAGAGSGSGSHRSGFGSGLSLTRRLKRLAKPGKLVAAAAVLVVVSAGAAVYLSTRAPETAAPATVPAGEQTALAILPFRNASGDASLDWLGPSLSEILRTEVGQSPQLRTIGSDRLQQLLNDLRISGDSNLDPATLRRLAEFSNAHSVMWGQFLKFGNEIRIDATIEDLRGQRSIPLKAQAPNQGALVTALGELARSVREQLAPGAAAATDLGGVTKPSTQSLLALRYYNDGIALSRQGKHSDALKQYEAATKEDPEFALAYAKLAEAYKNLSYDNEAEQFSRKASSLSDALPAREKYLILAGHARILGDNQKAIESYENLLKASPDDLTVHYELARLQEDTGALDQSREHYLRVLKDDPKYVDGLLAVGRVEIRRREPQAAIDYLNQGLTLAIQFDNAEARGNILHAMGIAYRRLNKDEEALRYYNEALEIRRRLGQKGGIAASLHQIAQVNVTLGQSAAALKNFNEALEVRREIGDKRGVGETLLELGNFHFRQNANDQALKFYRESLQIQRDVGNKNYEGLVLNNIGSLYFNQAQYDDALTYFERALALREEMNVASEIAQTVHNVAEVNVKMGQYDRALEHYLRALELSRKAGNKRSAAIEAYSVGTLFEYQARYAAALSSKEEALNTLRGLGENGFWLIEMLSGHGNALSQLGRFEEARNRLNEALKLARDLKNEVLIAQTANFLGDSYFYAADFVSARSHFEQAMPAASAAKDRHMMLLTQVNFAKLDAREKPAAAVPVLTRLVRETDAEGLRYLSLSASIHLGEALQRLKRYDAARQEFMRAVTGSERLGLRALLAGGHHGLASVFAAEGNSGEAARHRADATRLVNEIQKEAGTEAVKKRADLAQMLVAGTTF